MIKEYFTDGLIGLAILLSLFRTDLIGLNINNLINYPEVQDIILGQTAAYLPASFHNFQNVHHPSNSKHIDFDNEAFSAWFQNVNNLPWLPQGVDNDIEAFLVSGSETAVEPVHTVHTSSVSSNEHLPGASSPTLPSEGANSFTDYGSASSSSADQLQDQNVTSSSNKNGSNVLSELSSIFTNPFPGCNLTKEEVNLIDVLWRQDVDLGVGKEVFDQALREELEKERELEHTKKLEMQKSQVAAQQKEERDRQMQAGKWLKQNFVRDGETGEWVRLQNGSSENSSIAGTSVTVDSEASDSGEFLTLEAALDYISSSVDPSLIHSLDSPQENPLGYQDDLSVYQGEPFQDIESNGLQALQNLAAESSQLVSPPTEQLLEQQGSLEETWNGLVDYLNMTANSLDVNASVAPQADQMNSSVALTSDMGLSSEADSTNFLLQNASLPGPSIDAGIDFGSLTPMEDLGSTLPMQTANPTLNLGSVDWDLDDISFFENITGIEDGTVGVLGLEAVDDFFMNISSSEGAVTAIGESEAGEVGKLLDDNHSDSALSTEGASPNDELRDVFDGLEGAIGGSELPSSNDSMMEGPYNKMSRLSESSNDSGYTYQAGFSSGSSSASSYAGSPSSSHNGNSSSASNDTEHDPHGTRALAQQVAHNHTYNTLPGQIPREVKKYAHKEPSRKGPQSRDQRRAEELKVPFSVDEIIESPVETFNDMLTKYKLTEAQLILIRDIRRRGKNKVAAQNCRKRKVGVIVTLADEMIEMQKVRDRLVAERAEMEKETRKMKEKFSHLYTHIFQSLRNERGEPYDPNLYSLQQSSDGNVFLVPRNVNGTNNNGSNPTGKDSTNGDHSTQKKRKSYDE